MKKKIEIFVNQETKDALAFIAQNLSVGVATVVKLAIEEFLLRKK